MDKYKQEYGELFKLHHFTRVAFLHSTRLNQKRASL